MNRIPTLKLTEEKFKEIMKSDYVIENLLYYDISPEEAKKYINRLLR